MKINLNEYLNQDLILRLCHGTSSDNAISIKNGSPWRITRYRDDKYLGSGVYFFEDNGFYARHWAEGRYKGCSAVLVCFAKVKRKHIFDLANERASKLFIETLKKLKKTVKEGDSINSSAVIECICKFLPEKAYDEIKLVRGYHAIEPLTTHFEDVQNITAEYRQLAKVQVWLVVRDTTIINNQVEIQ